MSRTTILINAWVVLVPMLWVSLYLIAKRKYLTILLVTIITVPMIAITPTGQKKIPMTILFIMMIMFYRVKQKQKREQKTEISITTTQ